MTNHRTLYFPPGTYLISETILWRPAPDKPFGAFLTWQGAGTERTVIRLKDNCPGFQDAAKPKAMCKNGSMGKRPGDDKDGGGNRAHNNYIFDMTFDAGRGNPGAIGVDFVASNTGAMVDVAVVSQDGRGAIGLKLDREVGPCLIQHVSVQGFDVGVKVSSALYGIAFEHIRLEGQHEVGFSNHMNVCAVRDLVSVNDVPAVTCKGGVLCLIDSQLRGSGPAAVEMNGQGVIRNVTTSGYKQAVAGKEKSVAGPEVAEEVFGSTTSLFDAPLKTLNLPVPASPQFHDNDLKTWANVADFGAKFRQSGEKTQTPDATEAVQKAIDSGATTVYFPHGWYNVEGTVIVRGNVRRIIGFNSWLKKNKTIWRFENKHPVAFERFNDPGVLEIRSDRPVLGAHMIGPAFHLVHPKAELHVENCVQEALQIGAGQSVYARQLNIEKRGPRPMVVNDGGAFWALCYKTEWGNTVCTTRDAGRSEILGGLFYAAQGFRDGQLPLLVNENAHVTASFQDIAFYPGGKYQVIVKETQNGQTRELTRKDATQGNWVIRGLYAGRSGP
jgi:hypothetical protein